MRTTEGEVTSPEDRASGRLPVAPSMRPVLESPQRARRAVAHRQPGPLRLRPRHRPGPPRLPHRPRPHAPHRSHHQPRLLRPLVDRFVVPPGTTWARSSSSFPSSAGSSSGLMARYGSAAIRGHGIPEAMEQVLFNESRIPARMTFLKPLSAAIAIGTGGPVRRRGADHRDGRRARLAPRPGPARLRARSARPCWPPAPPRACPPRSAARSAAVLLAVELLLFEYRPRSLIPVALASAAACGVRMALRRLAAGLRDARPWQLAERRGAAPSTSGSGAIVGRRLGAASRARSTPSRTPSSSCPSTGCGGRRSAASSSASSGCCRPHTLGVGYDNIDRILSGDLAGKAVARRSARSSSSPGRISLGSGTSGGTLAPLFTIGGGAGRGCSARRPRAALPRAGVDVAHRGARRDGGALRGRLARAAGLGRLRLRDHAPADGAPAAARRLHRRVPGVGPADAELDHDGEDRAPRGARASATTRPTSSSRCSWPTSPGAGRLPEGPRHVRRGARMDCPPLGGLGSSGVPGRRRRGPPRGGGHASRSARPRRDGHDSRSSCGGPPRSSSKTRRCARPPITWSAKESAGFPSSPGAIRAGWSAS